ncbi:MAG: ATP-dependent DNA helicase [Acidimicrobiia bacterium]|nr:ATP-dependent DNA helicase [Acidimicrobiia bacterium]
MEEGAVEPGARATELVDALRSVVAQLPGGGEARPGQVLMAEAVANAIWRVRHLIVQAGTGTGKSLGYLVPLILARRTVVVATATKALQDQLIGRDLPFLAEHLDVPFRYAALKGRSNYLCLQRASEVLKAEKGELTLEGMDFGAAGGSDAAAHRAQVLSLVEWGTSTADGDRAGLSFEPTPKAWGAVSVGADECPGASRCPMGEACFAERARATAAGSDVVVVNTHLYGVHVSAGLGVLPEHDVVVFDEAHQLEDVVSATAGFEIGPGRFSAVARTARAVLAEREIPDAVEGAAGQLVVALAEHNGKRVKAADVAQAVGAARGRLERLGESLRTINPGDPDSVTRKARAQKALLALTDDLDRVLVPADDDVAWVEGPPGAPVLKVAPIDVAVALAPIWDAATVVLTSATIPPHLATHLGAPRDRVDELDVGSPFDYEHNGLLYCAAHIPDPRNAGYADAVADELTALITAAGGRTLALFTSWRAMQAALEAVRPRVDTPILAQGELPKPALVDAFAADEATSLFATMGFWQGIDVPGRTSSVVVIDRLPFPRPDDPLLQARREKVGRSRSFATVDLPRAATLLAQGAGRLIRSASDRGVVAVLDPRLATATYRWDIVNALPPFRRTRHRADVEAFLRQAEPTDDVADIAG